MVIALPHKKQATHNTHVIFNRIATIYKSIVVHYQSMREKSRSRYYLVNMSPHLLKDIGLNETDRQVEISKKFWQ